jgi:hypothetical protein
VSLRNDVCPTGDVEQDELDCADEIAAAAAKLIAEMMRNASAATPSRLAVTTAPTSGRSS